MVFIAVANAHFLDLKAKCSNDYLSLFANNSLDILARSITLVKTESDDKSIAICRSYVGTFQPFEQRFDTYS